MTLALAGYSGVFMRYALAVSPKNYLLFGCHVVNFSAQATQGYRFVDYWYMGGKDKITKQKAEQGLDKVEDKAEDLASKAKEQAKGAVEGVKEQVNKVTGR